MIPQDDLFSMEREKQRVLLEIVYPIYTNLLVILIRKAEFPPDDMTVSSEDKEGFRCYRQDIADTVVNLWELYSKI